MGEAFEIPGGATSDAALKRRLRGGRYALIGAGQLGEMALDLWPEGLPRPEFLLDSHRTGTLRDVEIRDLPSHRPVPGVVYLASAFKVPARDIRAFFDQVGQTEILTAYDLLEEYTPDTFTNGWRNLAPPPEIRAKVARLPEAYADAASRRICEAVSAWRYERRLVSDHPIGPEDGKYDLSLRGRGGTHYRCVYDCGSYDLSLPDSLARSGVTFDHFVAFEPDPARFAICAARLPAREAATGAVFALRREAVSDRDGTATFMANGLFSARLVADGVVHPALMPVETCTLSRLDEALFGQTATGDGRVLIKLHVESAEFPALQGAERLLRAARCDLLVNLSHDEISYREVPPYLAALGCFDITLHAHAVFGEGLTLFARHRL